MPASYGFGLIEALRVDEEQSEAAFLSFLAQVQRELNIPVLREYYDGQTFIDGGAAMFVAEARDGRIEKREIDDDQIPELPASDIPRGTLDKLIGGIDLILPAGPTEADIEIPEALFHEDLDNPMRCISTDEARRRLDSLQGLDAHDRAYVDDLSRCCQRSDELAVAISLSWL